MEKRISWIDMTKGYGVLLVIIGHMYIFNLSSWIYSFHMPLFLFISGYVFKVNITFVDFVYKKIKSLIVPYFFLAFLIIVYEIICGITNGQKINILRLILNYLLQRRESALWFLTCLFIIELTMFLVIKIKNMLLQSCVVVGITLLGLLYEYFINVPIIWNVDIAMTTIVFFYTGYLFRKKDIMNKCFSFPRVYPWMFLILGILNFVGAVVNNKISGGGLELMAGEYGFWPITYLVAVIGVMAVLIFAHQYTSKYIIYLGRNSIIYFGLHQSIMMPFMDKVYEKLDLFQDTIRGPGSIIMESFITLCIIVIVLTLFNEIIMRTKLKFLVGRR